MDNQNFDQQTPPVEPKAQSASSLNKGLIIGLSAGIVILLAAVIYLLTAKQAASPAADKNQQIENQELVEDNSQTTTADWKTYKNEEYGFELTFSDTWKGYKVFSSEGSQGVGAPTYLQFALPTTDKSQSVINVTDNIFGYSAPLTITVIAKDRGYQGTGIKIAEDNNNAYYYSVNKDLPKDLQELNFEISKVIASFKFTN